MTQVFLDALFDSLKMLPLLLLIYIAIEFIEFKYEQNLRKVVQKAGKAGPAYGALAGAVPQCGFSVISTALYSKKLITLGTLMAVYLSTSDEAIPVILSQPEKLGTILPIIGVKILIAIIAGFSIDFFWRRKNKLVTQDLDCDDDHCHEGAHHHEIEIEEIGCCGHDLPSEKPNLKKLVWHPVIHTMKIFSYIFIVTLILNIIFWQVGDETISKIFLGHTIFQPVITALFGLIPNCAASVAITQLYLQNAISFGSVIAGLSASAGLGLIVLTREDHKKKDVLKIVGLLFGISAISGILIQLFVH
jgi:hypothetical protein